MVNTAACVDWVYTLGNIRDNAGHMIIHRNDSKTFTIYLSLCLIVCRWPSRGRSSGQAMWLINRYVWYEYYLRPLYSFFVRYFIIFVDKRCAAVCVVHLVHLMWRPEGAQINICCCGSRIARLIVRIRCVVAARYVQHSRGGRCQWMLKVSAWENLKKWSCRSISV